MSKAIAVYVDAEVLAIVKSARILNANERYF
ncbi:hypothetical protein M728_005275 (plasmid) [Ensifer sp. WSM1721]